MSFAGTWRNQYGSILKITGNANGRVTGRFETALDDSAFHGQSIELVGRCDGDVIVCACAGEGPLGPAGVSYTGLLRDGRIESMWVTVASTRLLAPHEGAPAKREAVPAWRAFGIGADRFERI